MENNVQSTAGTRTEAAVIWQPLLVRALVAAAFGAFTIFWQEPSARVMALSGAFFLVGTGAAIHWLRERLRAADVMPGSVLTLRLLRLSAAVLFAGGVLTVILPTPDAFAITAAAALLIVGAVEIFLGLRYRRSSDVGRDWLITGIVNAATALVLLALPLLAPWEPHSVLGVLGGSAIITAVVLLLAALGYRHDARTDPPVRPEDVN